MKVIAFDNEAYKVLIRKIDRIADYIQENERANLVPESDPAQVWITNEDAAEILRVSRRTMQRLRSKGKITYSIRGGKVWYTLAEVRRMLPGQVVKSSLLLEDELKYSHQEQHARKRKGGRQ